MTEVICASKTHECVFPTISTDTMGSSVYSRTPLKVVSEACLKAALTASTEVSFFALNVISVSEPLITGTRIPHHQIQSASSGKIFVSAFAAPVVVGTIDCTAARARLKSLCGWS